MRLIKPARLRTGARLGIVTCSTPLSACGPDAVQRARERLEARGFEWIEAPNTRTTYGHSAGTVRDRVRALHAFFRDPKIDAILSFWGGFQSHQLLEYLDYDLIRRHPKPLLGYSDTTALSVGIHARTGLVTFSGPAGITFAKPTLPDFTWEHLEKVLMQPTVPFPLQTSKEYSDNPWFKEPSQTMTFEPNPGWRVFRQGRAEGALIGGNVGTMLLLAGTAFWPNLKNKILFVEDDEAETPRTMDRCFTHLRQLGAYDQIKGLIVGRFHRDVKFTPSDSLEMILKEALRGTKFPVLTGVDFGHTDPLVTLPLGVRARLETRRPSITLLEAAVR